MAGSKSKAGNFLSGGDRVCVCGEGGGVSSQPFSGLPTACMLMCHVVTAPSHLTVSVCTQVCVRECVTGRESNS